MDENVDYEERESEFDLEDEDKSVQLNEEHKDIDVEVFFSAKTSLVCLFVCFLIKRSIMKIVYKCDEILSSGCVVTRCLCCILEELILFWSQIDQPM